MMAMQTNKFLFKEPTLRSVTIGFALMERSLIVTEADASQSCRDIHNCILAGEECQ
jgi:hypothetical protein